MQKQPSSQMCFACGRENPIGLHLHFFSDEAGRVHTEFTPAVEHQGYPGVMHGGLVTALLDETIGRTAIANDLWCMTARLVVRFLKPVPIGRRVRVTGEMTRSSGYALVGRGRIQAIDDEDVLAEAEGTFVRIPDDQLGPFKAALLGWRVDD